ncbi:MULTISPECIES: hypothetical protein [unclassified Halomonas]|uniref:hypothetical protein n=1 Tax=unclassified Halomonas TaxID=2609666 RepID=UPI0021E3F6D0|nr:MULTISPECIES: hypothetical protein [unclassified Halomonas]UYG00590.1 hypothetical protein OCT39_03280 [Halomonas sp. GD1P12]WNL38344.1 hypothetical protein RN346_13700 [Halomonas sp. PAMB 3232]
MNTLPSHQQAFAKGVVTRSGYRALSDAEGYGAASSIGAGSTYIALLWQAFGAGEALSLYSNSAPTRHPATAAELADWCQTHFPDCYGEYLARRTPKPSEPKRGFWRRFFGR